MSKKFPSTIGSVTQIVSTTSSGVTVNALDNHLAHIQAHIEALTGITSITSVGIYHNTATRLAQILVDGEDYEFTDTDIEEFDEMIHKYNVKYKSKLVKALK